MKSITRYYLNTDPCKKYIFFLLWKVFAFHFERNERIHEYTKRKSHKKEPNYKKGLCSKEIRPSEYCFFINDHRIIFFIIFYASCRLNISIDMRYMLKFLQKLCAYWIKIFHFKSSICCFTMKEIIHIHSFHTRHNVTTLFLRDKI